MNALLPAAMLLALSAPAFAATPEVDDTTLGVLARPELDRDADQARERGQKGGGRSQGASRGPSPSRGAPAARPASPSRGPGPSAGPSHGPSSGPSHAAPAQGGPPAHAGRPDHAGPPTHAGPPAHAGRPAHAGPPPHAGPPDHAGRPDHAGPPSGPDRGGPPDRNNGGHVPGDQDMRAAQAHSWSNGDRPASAGPRPAPVQPRHIGGHRHAPPHFAPAPPRVAVHYGRPVHVHHVHYVRPYHGVFVYGPRPVYHTGYAGRQEVEVQPEHLPERKIDRENTLAVGAFGGSYAGLYDNAAGYSDIGGGLNVRYRPDETVGLEVAVSNFGMESDDSMRSTTVGQASVQLFAYPWTRVSPYVTGGLTMAPRTYRDAYFDESLDQVLLNDRKDVAFGPHVGLGVEFALGKSIALDLDARYTALLGQPEGDPTWPGSVQTRVGVLFHFK